MPTTIDPKRAAFLAAIRATPTDTTRRLAFADYLDEQGESGWAKVIRTVVEAGSDEEDETVPQAICEIEELDGTLGYQLVVTGPATMEMRFTIEDDGYFISLKDGIPTQLHLVETGADLEAARRKYESLIARFAIEMPTG